MSATQPISSTADAAREAHRDPSTGQFGTQPAAESDASLSALPTSPPVPVNQVFPFNRGEPYFDLGEVELDGHRYVTNRYLAVRADQLDLAGSPTCDLGPRSVPWSRADLADTVDPDPDSLWSPDMVGPLTRSGFQVRGGPETVGTPNQAHAYHVYRDGDHVGWAMNVRNLDSRSSGVRFADVPALVSHVGTGSTWTAWDRAGQVWAVRGGPAQ